MKYLLLTLALALPLAAHAQPERPLERDPGYVDLSVVDAWFDAEPRVEVNVRGALLKLVAEASRYEDPELATLLHRLRAIQVRGYGLRGQRFDDVAGQAGDVGRRLERDGWETVVRVREDDERVDMLVRIVDGEIAGLVVLALTPGDDDAVFVNIVGEIDPEQIGRIGRRFRVSRLEEF